MKSKNYPILNFNSLQMYNKNGNIGASVPDNKQLSRLLRIKVLFLLAAIGLSGSVAAQTSSPNARISLDLQNVPLKEVFARIEDQSNYIFVYYDSILDASRRVSISVSDQPVGNVLEVLFAGTENTWKLSGRQIVIGKAAAAGKAEKADPAARHGFGQGHKRRTPDRRDGLREGAGPASVRPPTSTETT